jgi:hypothetical protein
MPDPRAYRRLAALLRDQITSGMLAAGAQLPSIGELRHKHGPGRGQPGRHGRAQDPRTDHHAMAESHDFRLCGGAPGR